MKHILSKIFLIIRKYLRGLRIAFKGKKIFVVNNNSYCEDDLATNHITDFLKDKKSEILSLPTGQGIFFKI